MSALDLDTARMPADAPSAPATPARPASAVALPGGRDLRLDMFRGLALVMIFINHVPGTVFENWTSRNFGFSDAAEAFVFMSGMAAGLAYSRRFADGPWLAGLLKVWARARQLYLVHMTTTAIAIAIFAGAAMWFGHYELLTKINLAPLFSKTLGAIVGLPLLTHQLGYFNILPLYLVLLLATPFVMPLALKRPLWLLVGSIALWAAAGQFRLNFPNFPNPGGWFFNPFSWQLLFVVGLLSGTAMKQGKRFVPNTAWLRWLSGLFLLFILVWMKVPAVGEAGRWFLGQVAGLGAPFYITWFDKTFVALPRLLHALALVAFLSSLVSVRRIAESRFAAPLILLGRHGLPVFATGSVLSILMQAIKAGTGQNLAIDTLIIVSGLGAQLLLALALSKSAALTASTQRNRS